MEWISVENRLPEPMVNVRCITRTTTMGNPIIDDVTGFMYPSGKWSCSFDWTSVTHWMPLPEPPKQDK